MSRRTALIAVAVLAAVGALAYYRWHRQPLAPPAPPAADVLTDPLSRKMVESKRQAVLVAPGSAAAWGELGMAFDTHEAAAEATDCYRRAMELDPADARWPYLLAGHVNRGSGPGDSETAIQLYRKAAECPSPGPAHRATALLTLGDLLTEVGRGAEAAPLYEQVHAADPNNPWAAYRVGAARAEKGDREAERILLGLTRNPYAQKKAVIALAGLCRRSGRTKEAEAFDSAAEQLPTDRNWANPFAAEVGDLRRGRRALMNRYVAQEAAQDSRAAVHTATALADQYPSVETQMILLRALVNVGQFSAGVAVADDIMRDEDGRRLVTAHAFLGLARLGLADRAEAEGRKSDADRLLAQAAESLAESVRLKPDYAPGHLYGAKVLLRLGRLPEAEAAVRAGIGCRPEEWEGYLILADVLSARSRKPEAVAAVEQAVKLAPQNEPRPRRALDALKK